MESKVSYRVCLEHECVHPAPPEEVFPLLCPVREYEWIDTWDCHLVHTESGVAEEGCVFDTDFGYREHWVVTLYEPPRRIEFCIFAEAGYVERLKIVVRPEGQASSVVHWERTYTALNRAGETAIRHLVEPVTPDRTVVLDQMLEHFVRTGAMLRQSELGAH